MKRAWGNFHSRRFQVCIQLAISCFIIFSGHFYHTVHQGSKRLKGHSMSVVTSDQKWLRLKIIYFSVFLILSFGVKYFFRSVQGSTDSRPFSLVYHLSDRFDDTVHGTLISLNLAYLIPSVDRCSRNSSSRDLDQTPFFVGLTVFQGALGNGQKSTQVPIHE